MTQILEKEMGVGDPQTYAIIGAAMAVHRHLGAGFLESVYQEALGIEFERCGIPYAGQPAVPIVYRDRTLTTFFKPDFLCYGNVIVEIKAHQALGGPDEAQLINYLKATRHPTGLLINFGRPSLEYRRRILSTSPQSA